MLLFLLAAESLHQCNRRRFVLSICSIDYCCSTNCFVAICIHSKYTVRTPSVSYVVFCSAACCCADESCVVVPDGGYKCFCFFVFPAFSVFSLKNIYIYSAPLGSTVALTALSCIPVRLPLLQPLRACAEPPAGVSLPRRSPPCMFV